ncbi:MAG: DUF4058 family protein [Dehalococcoidia bacterium]|nr:DUF4058 family protein [Dehalococcoidia bacterium]
MRYDNPFPGMNPYLENPDIWPDFHNGLVGQLRDVLGPQLPDRYRIALQRRVEVEEPFGASSGLNLRVPGALVTNESAGAPPADGETPSAVATLPDEVVAVRVRMPREVGVLWLRVETVLERELVTVVEVLSPTNKRPGEGRRRYIRKREGIVAGLVNPVEIDLLRCWEPMPLETAPPASDYRILVCRSLESPGAVMYPFMVQQRIPKFTLPLLSEDETHAPEVDLGAIVDNRHHTARYNLETRYNEPPQEPSLGDEAGEWVKERLGGMGRRSRHRTALGIARLEEQSAR